MLFDKNIISCAFENIRNKISNIVKYMIVQINKSQTKLYDVILKFLESLKILLTVNIQEILKKLQYILHYR